ncbi:uncharacterized protein [Nicotiana tomentosiformis]|uniref:uncharacterized protein n=1 Tax=Nicotiana tomentosiformis TaxID=4098 RepID=UPI00388CD2D2
MAEYEACILGIRIAVDKHIKELLVIRDFNLLIHQVQGEWSTKNVKILPYMHCLKDLCKKFTKIEFKHVPKNQNEFVDALATLSSKIQHPNKNYIDPIEVEMRDQHSYYFHVEEETNSKPWYHGVEKFLTTREYSENATNGQRHQLIRQSRRRWWQVVSKTTLSKDLGYQSLSSLTMLRTSTATS